MWQKINTVIDERCIRMFDMALDPRGKEANATNKELGIWYMIFFLFSKKKWILIFTEQTKILK